MTDEEYNDWDEWYGYLAENPDDAADYYRDSGYGDNPEGAADHARRSRKQLEYSREETE